ncbi:hypothetical protein [Mesorhizobium sp. INR15]|uniref:hypothetical protein n=1 Tax=Mesorhizobium sp. INR15 TaxID=2654248 RepID=UPI0018969AE4|nr:hypothetical protein [Mesorhizobium sp. INR15]QPC92595.1 hypothetical protein GA829_19520 [Mesorhizobium sp. INR15]
MTTYLIMFTDNAGQHLGHLQTAAWSHWDACEFGWDNALKGTDDFQVFTEDAFIQMTGATLGA